MIRKNTLKGEPFSIQSEIERKEKAGKNYTGKELVGFLGEQEVCYQLEISHRNLYYLWDVTLQNKIGKAQIDFLVFTPKMCFVIEVKNWTGEIIVDESLDIIQNGEIITIDNPIKTNENKLRLIESLVKQDSKYLGGRKRKLNDFSKYFKSVIVFSRTRDKKRCVLKNESGLGYIIREDALVDYIEKTYNAEKCDTLSQKELQNWMLAFDEMNLRFKNSTSENIQQEKRNNLDEKKYKSTVKKELKVIEKDDFKSIEQEFKETRIFKLVKEWRLEQCRAEGINAQNVFWDRQIFTIIVGNINTVQEMIAIKGIAEEKVIKYGEGIIQIMKTHPAEVREVIDKYGDILN